MIKAIIFDFDGTVSNRQKNAYDVFDAYARDIFKDLNDIEYEAVLQDYLTDDCNGTINCKFRLAPFINKYKDYLPDNFEQDYTEYLYDKMGEYAVLKDEFIDVITKLRKDYKLAILSNGQSESQRKKIIKVDVSKYFDEIIVSGEVGINKPNKEVFEIMANRLNVSPNECLFVGDVFSSDILGAIRANMTPVWILEDSERPCKYYHGYRIRKLPELFNILDKENNA